MRPFFFFLLTASIIAACSATTDSSQTEKPEAIDGEKIFRIYCVQCHGLYGDMQANGAKDLKLSVLTLEERVQVITHGRNTMTPFKELLSEEKIRAVAAYTLEFKKKE